MRRFSSFVLALTISIGGAAQGAAASPVGDAPAVARKAGYTVNTFSTNRFSAENVDLKASASGGFQWYGWSFFAENIASNASKISTNADGSVTVGAAFMASAARTPKEPYFTGVAFGGGGYFEAELKFDPTHATGRAHWPSWWGMSIEHLAEMPAPFGRWQGRSSNFEHFGEMDFFEYNNAVGRAPNQYGGTLHDWYGEHGKSCSKYCATSTSYRASTITVPRGTDWNKYHKVGALWVPAAKNSKGYITFYFDGTPMNTFYWEGFSPDEGPPLVPSLARSTTHSVNDVLHMAIILGGAEKAPMTVRSVNVWQASDKYNWRN